MKRFRAALAAGLLLAAGALLPLAVVVWPAIAESPTDAPCAAPITTGACSQTALWKKIVNLLNTGLSINPSSAAAVGITPLSALNATSLVLKGTPGNFWSGYALNRTSTPGFLVIYNATAAPAPGALTAGLVLGCVPLPANGVASLNNKPGPPQVYSTGITELITSAANCGTYTTGVITADIFGDAT